MTKRLRDGKKTEGWKNGRIKKKGSMEVWKDGRLEEWKVGRKQRD